MPALLALLLLAQAPKSTNQVPQVVELLKAKKTTGALGLLKTIAGHEGNHEEAKSLVKMIRSASVKKPPEVMEASFLALRGIGSRKVTKSVVALLKHSKLKKKVTVRIGVCRALGGSADPAGVETLIDLMRDKEDKVVAEAADAAGAFRYDKESIRKDLFKTILNIYESNWNLKNSVDPELKKLRSRAEKKWEIIEAPMEKSLQLLSNVTQNAPPDWRRWWNKNKRRRWAELEN